MPDSVKTRGLPVPRFHEVALLVGLVALVWWGWRELGQRQARRQFWNPDASWVDRDRAIEALVAEGPTSIPELIRGLMADDPRIRSDAARALGNIGSAAESAADPLKHARKDPQPTVRKAVVRALPQIIPDDPEIVDLLIGVMTGDDDSSVREAAAYAIGMLGESAIPSLIPLMGDSRPGIRRHGVLLMYRMAMASQLDGEAPEILAALWSCAEDLDSSIRDHALLTLLQMHRAPREKIVEWLHEPNRLIVFRSLEALSWFDADKTALLPDLMCVLEASERRGQTGPFNPHGLALKLMRSMGTASLPAVPALLRLLQNADDSTRREEILSFLIEIDADRDSMLAALVPALDDHLLCETAGGLLQRIAPEVAMRQTERLVSQLDDEDPQTANTALRALYGMRSVAVAAAPELAERLATQPPTIVPAQRGGYRVERSRRR